jgi:hypothetical protein
MYYIFLPSRFSADIWASDRYARYRMVENLLNTHSIKGRTIQQTRDLLGEPDHIETYNNQSPKKWFYHMYGDSYILEIKFDEQGIVTSFAVFSLS